MTSLIISIIGAALWLILCAAVGNLAERRGHSGVLWYLFSLFFSPLIGFAIVAALPSLKTLGPDIAYKQCPHCPAMVKVGADICPFCHRELVGKPKDKAAA